MFCVYVLKLNNGDLYIGYTSNLKQRIKYHQGGKSKFTKSCRPIKLVYFEAYLSKDDAAKREYKLKTGQQRELLKERIQKSIT